MERDFWIQRYRDNQTGWNIGEISAPLKEYIDQLTDKNLRILIPGCGFGFEAAYLFQKGFHNTFVLDFAGEALTSFAAENPDFPKNQLLNEDFFTHRGTYDLILEQTLFCAIDPVRRAEYVRKIHELLVPGGKLVGLLFNREFENGPPFGGSKEEYLELFGEKFSSVSMEPCYNSIPKRAGTELFIRIFRNEQ